MISKLFSTLGRIGHTCSDFGNYFMSFQRRCLKSGQSYDCEGIPTLDEAGRDYREMMSSRHDYLRTSLPSTKP